MEGNHRKFTSKSKNLTQLPIVQLIDLFHGPVNKVMNQIGVLADA